MIDRVGIFIDGANIFYGLNGRRIDYNHFKSWLANGRVVGEASFFHASQRDNSSMQAYFDCVRDAGFNVFVKQMTKNSVTGEWKQSGVDVFLAVKAMRYNHNFDTLILVSGDYDFTPLIDEMRQFGKNIEVVSFEASLHPFYKRFNFRLIDDYLKEVGL